MKVVLVGWWRHSGVREVITVISSIVKIERRYEERGARVLGWERDNLVCLPEQCCLAVGYYATRLIKVDYLEMREERIGRVEYKGFLSQVQNLVTESSKFGPELVTQALLKLSRSPLRPSMNIQKTHTHQA